jgi:lysophospholipase L1-like esterase
MQKQKILHRPALLSGRVSLCLMLAACGSGSGATDEVAAIVANAAAGNFVATSSPAPAPAPHATAKPSGIPATHGVIVQAGDSIGVGLGADNWAAIDHLGLPRGISIHNVSVSGQWMLTGLGQRETALYPFYDKQHTSVLLIQQGTNDLVGGDTAPYLYFNILKPFVSLSQAAGFYVAVDTILPRSDPGWTADAAHEQNRLEYNKLVRANSIGADAINDIAADPLIGDSVNPSVSLLYADGLHLRKAGQQRLAQINSKTLARLLEYPRRTPKS